METKKNTADEKEIIEFKSYYVVWKQNVMSELRIFFSEFKSYYVVWKLGWSDGERTEEICLNRTM